MGKVTCLLSSLSSTVFPTEIIRGMGTSFECSDSLNHLGGQKLVMIGRWYSRKPLTNQNERVSTKRSQNPLRRKLVSIPLALHWFLYLLEAGKKFV